MAILICPACGTGYEIQAVFPPGGRKARCYKCGQMWLATPVATPLAEPASPAPPAEPASGAAPAGPTSGAASVPETVAAPVASSPSQSAAAISLAQAFSGIVQAATAPKHEAHLAKAELVIRLDLHDQDHPDTPVLAERPVPRQEGGDATTLGLDIGCRLQGRLLHGAT